MPYPFNNSSFTQRMRPFGMEKNKGMWVLYRNTRIYRTTLELFDFDTVRAVKFLNASLNGSEISIRGHRYHARVVLRNDNLKHQIGTRASLAKYKKAIQALFE